MSLLVILGCFFAAGFSAAGINWIGLRWYPDESLHWTESARKLYPIRKAAALNIWLIPSICTIGLLLLLPADADVWVVPGVAISAFTGAIIGTFPFDKKMFPQYSFRAWLRFVCGNWFLRFGWFGTLITGGILMPENFGRETIFIGTIVVGLLVALNFGLWLQLAKLAGLIVAARETNSIAVIVRRTSERMKIPFHAIWILRSPIGYAAAMPLTGSLIFSEGFLNLHPEEEIAAICAHEFAHLNEPRSVKTARLLVSLGWVPFIFVRPLIHSHTLWIGVIGLPLVLTRLSHRKLGRKMEVRADAIADQNEEQSGVYARALERLYRNNQVPAVMPGNRRVHPHLYDRMLAAGVMPDYPRPKVPSNFNWSNFLMFFVLIILLGEVMSRH